MKLARLPYSWRALAGDLAGGAIAALIALPYGLALASMMGLPPVLGLVTSIVTAPVTALLGRNPVLIGGTASATVPFIAEAVHLQGVGGAAKVCILASVFMLIFCVLRLGRHIQKVPQPVVTGFSCGIGAMMFLSQLGVMLGVKAVVDRTSNNMLLQSWQVLSHFAETQPSAVIISTVVIIAGLLSARLVPRAPAPLIGVIAAVAVAGIFGLHQREVGHLPIEVPSFAAFSWSAADVLRVTPEALRTRVRCLSQPAGYIAGRRAFPRPPSSFEGCGRGCGTRRLRYSKHNRGYFRCAHERRDPRAQPGERSLRRLHAALQFLSRGLHFELHCPGFQVHLAHPNSGACRCYRLHRHLPA